MGNSIIDGLKSRLMQYLKHVVEDDVLFTKVISKFESVTLILCVWLQVINKVKFILQGEGHIKFKVKYLHSFKFYVAYTLLKWLVCI